MDASFSRKNVNFCCGCKKVFHRLSFQWIDEDGVGVVVVDDHNIPIALAGRQRETACLVTVDLA